MPQLVQDQSGNLFMQYEDGSVVPYTQSAQQSLMPQAPVSAPMPEQAADPLESAQDGLFSGFQKVGKDKLMESLGYGEAAAESLPAAGEVAATAGQNAAWNSAATGGEVLPEVAAQGGAFELGGIGSAGNALLPLAGAYGAYNLAESQGDAPSGGRRHSRGLMQGAASGAAMGSYFGPPGAIIGGIIGGTAGLAGSVFGSSKGGRQMTRDEWRSKILESGTPLFDESYQGDLADGTTFDFGKDKFGFGKKEGDIDLTKKTTGKAAAYGNALAALQGYGSGDDREAIATQFTAASTANAKDPNDLKTVKDNYRHFLGKLGINDKEQAYEALYNNAQNIGQKNWQTFVNDMDELFLDSYPTGFDKNGNWVGVKR